MPTAAFAIAWSDGGYTTNLPIGDILNGQAFVAFEYDGRPLAPEHGGPARLVVPGRYFWKSAKWLRGLRLQAQDEPGLLGVARLPQPRRPVARRALQRRLGTSRPWPARISWQLATVTAIRDETPTVRSFTLGVPAWARTSSWPAPRPALTAADGYSVERSYSIASEPERADEIEITVERIDDGEVSPFLDDVVVVGDRIEVRGPIGGYFVWEAAPRRAAVPRRRRLRRRAADGDAPSSVTGWHRGSRRACCSVRVTPRRSSTARNSTALRRTRTGSRSSTR